MPQFTWVEIGYHRSNRFEEDAMRTRDRAIAVATAAAVTVGGIALVAAPAQAAVKPVPVNAAGATLTPSQIQHITGYAQHRTKARSVGGGVHGYTVEYSHPQSTLMISGTGVIRGKSPAAIRRGVMHPVPGQHVVANTYNPRTQTGRYSRVFSSTHAVKDAHGNDITVRVYTTLTYRYKKNTAVEAAATVVVPASSTNFRPSVVKADQAVGVLAHRYRV